jgi:hypothetical protein
MYVSYQLEKSFSAGLQICGLRLKYTRRAELKQLGARDTQCSVTSVHVHTTA